MALRIVVKLPPRTARQSPGTLRLLEESTGVELLACPCLGKADGQAAAAAGNPSRDPTKAEGDTPTGVYAAAKLLPIAPSDPNHDHMGDWFLPLIGISGDAMRAKNNGRHGLAIHAGRGDDRLVPTHGCLRIRTLDMTALKDALAGRAVDEIAIDETPTGA